MLDMLALLLTLILCSKVSPLQLRRLDLERGHEETDYHSNPPIAREIHPNRDSLSVKLEFQSSSGGILVINDDKELDIVPPIGAKNCK